MAQSNSGKIISELRIQQGITQKDLSEKCNIDIRTVQRIECGEVIPRFSTLQLIADALDVSIDILREKDGYQKASFQFYRFTWIIGIFQFLNFIPLVFWKDYQSVIVMGNLNVKAYTLFPILHIILGTLFYYGFFVWGRYRRIKALVVSSVVLIVIIPLSSLLTILSLYNIILYSKAMAVTVTTAIGINRLIFGYGIFKIQHKHKYLVFITGIMMLSTGLLYIIPYGPIQMASTILYFPVVILLILLVYHESKELFSGQDSSENNHPVSNV